MFMGVVLHRTQRRRNRGGTVSAAAIWSSADIAYIAIYRDMSKISRYSIAIYLSIFIEQLLINNHTIFMQVEAALLWW